MFSRLRHALAPLLVSLRCKNELRVRPADARKSREDSEPVDRLVEATGTLQGTPRMKDDNLSNGRPKGGVGSDGAGDKASKGQVIVKKYANRRLYNTATSSYVTLENLAAMVREGQDFVVQDARSGEDITRSVLTQVIFEEEARGREPMLPTSFLRQLIRLYGDTLQGYVPSYLEMAMSAFEQNQEQFRQQMTSSFGVTPGFAQFDAMTRANVDIFRKALEMFSSFAQPMGADVAEGRDLSEREKLEKAAGGLSSAPAKKAEGGAELDKMREQLAEMQKQVDALSRKR